MLCIYKCRLYYLNAIVHALEYKMSSANTLILMCNYIFVKNENKV